MKKTAVQWLIDELEKYEVYAKISYRCLGEIQIALDMEKEQIIEAFNEGQEYEYQYHINSAPKFYSETYYNETYKQD